MVTFLIVVQATAGVLLAAVSLFKRFQFQGGGLSRPGRIVFGVSALLFIGSVAWTQVLNDRSAETERQRNNAQMERLFESLREKVMGMTKGAELPPPVPASEAVRILEPRDGASVESKQLIQGQVAGAVSQLWVVVHPLETSSYWVQPRVSIAHGGDWKVFGYFGRSGSIDAGRAFEVLAIADPQIQLDEGMILDRWPPSRLASSVVTVMRK